MNIHTTMQTIPYEDPFAVYKRETQNGTAVSLLLESRSKDLRYGRESIIVGAPDVQIIGRNLEFEIKALSEKGLTMLDHIAHTFHQTMRQVDLSYSPDSLTGQVPSDYSPLSESERLRKISAASVLRLLLAQYDVQDPHAGLYGAFSYDFARQFENFGNRFTRGIEPDFTLFMPSELLVFDDIRERAVRKEYFFGKGERKNTLVPAQTLFSPPYITHDMADAEFIEKTSRIIEEIKNGELIQCVLSRTAMMNIQQAPVESYATLRRINPSPYSFFFNLGEGNYLFGASPELHVKVTGRETEIRPLAGTIGRKDNAIADYHARMQLLNDEKEQREHTMLVDLARNDLARVCDDVNVYEYLAIEEYPNLYHLGSGVNGTLKEGRDSIDLLLATLPAGTLSGAPKVRAMQMIEELENSRRGYYGGAIGFLGFNGNCNTGITIRSVYVHGGTAQVRAGAGIVHHSVPEKELAEVTLKNANQIKALGGAQ